MCCILFRQYCNITPLSPVSSLEKKVEIDKLAAEYIANVRNLPSEQRVEHLEKIQTAYSKCKEYSDDKVQLAMQTYEMVRGLKYFGVANFHLFIHIPVIGFLLLVQIKVVIWAMTKLKWSYGLNMEAPATCSTYSCINAQSLM